MSYFHVLDLSRYVSDTYRIANDYWKAATSNVRRSTLFAFDEPTPSTSSKYFIIGSKGRLDGTDLDAILFFGSAILMRVALYIQKSRRKALSQQCDNWQCRSTQSSSSKSASIESICYYMASYLYMLMPLLRAVRPPTRQSSLYFDRLRNHRELILFTGTALMFRFVYWTVRPPLQRRRRALASNNLEDETELYLIKMKNGFRDPKLQRFIDKCQEQKDRLKKVGSPEELRKLKIDDIRKKSLVIKKGDLQLSDEKLQSIRLSLNRVNS
ncbi:hypothetical protein MPSEU_000991900 [Mayamaea pseudoterrestris]|nr:hypothetical protein MPSEU_000991900 [Mayamaea pseudoterrestris]